MGLVKEIDWIFNSEGHDDEWNVGGNFARNSFLVKVEMGLETIQIQQ